MRCTTVNTTEVVADGWRRPKPLGLSSDTLAVIVDEGDNQFQGAKESKRVCAGLSREDWDVVVAEK